MSRVRPWRFPSAYDREPDMLLMVRRYAGRDEKPAHLEALAKRAHQLTGWAGRPIAWEGISEASREEARGHARWALQNVSLLAHHHEIVCCPEHGTHATPHRGCVLR